MTPTEPGSFLRDLRKLVGPDRTHGLSDAQLLECFAARRDETAFAALIGRHGRLVWRVCRQVLRHEHDAEDAFQAAFLVLARRAGSIRRGEPVAGWLYRAAYRVDATAV